MINYERQFLQSWDDVFYPRGPEMPEEEAQPVQVAQAPVEGEGGAAFGVFPAARSRSRAPTSEAAKMMVPDVAAGAVKGTVTGAVGLPGDIESLIRGVRGIFQRGGDQGKLDAFLAGMEENTILPTSEDVSKWLDANVGPVVPPGAPMAKERAGVAAAGQFAGELASSPAALVKGAKAGGRAAKETAKFVAPKVGEMLDSYMRRAGLTPELMAFHGTPARFAPEEGAPMGRFRAEKIGSGEGAQAFGYGLYFAESPGVAKGYQTALSGYSADGKRLPSDIGMVVSAYKGDVTAAIADRQSQLDKWLARKDQLGERVGANVVKGLQDEIKKLSALQGKRLEPTGSLYTVDIPDEMIGKMLDWDKPLSEQPQLGQKLYNAMTDAGFEKQIVNYWLNNKTGAELHWELAGRLAVRQPSPLSAEAQTSEFLRKAGIPGIRYLDRGSRGAAAETGTRNIVVFPGEEDKVKILKVE